MSPAADHVIFIHIPKAAGRTISSIAVRQYAADEVLQIKGGIGKAQVPGLDDRSAVRVVTGHVHYGVHRNLPGRSTYITMLREPVDRVLSLYRYIVTSPDHPLHDQLADIDPLAFASGSLDVEEIENGQTRQIAGVTQGSPDSNSLAVAKRNLAERFVAFGIVERFDESVILFKRRLRWKMPYYIPKNVTESMTTTESDPEAVEVIRTRNTLDAELYRFASNLFGEQLRREGPLFDVEVGAFRLLNSAARVYRRWRD